MVTTNKDKTESSSKVASTAPRSSKRGLDPLIKMLAITQMDPFQFVSVTHMLGHPIRIEDQMLKLMIRMRLVDGLDNIESSIIDNNNYPLAIMMSLDKTANKGFDPMMMLFMNGGKTMDNNMMMYFLMNNKNGGKAGDFNPMMMYMLMNKDGEGFDMSDPMTMMMLMGGKMDMQTMFMMNAMKDMFKKDKTEKKSSDSIYSSK